MYFNDNISECMIYDTHALVKVTRVHSAYVLADDAVHSTVKHPVKECDSAVKKMC